MIAWRTGAPRCRKRRPPARRHGTRPTSCRPARRSCAPDTPPRSEARGMVRRQAPAGSDNSSLCLWAAVTAANRLLASKRVGRASQRCSRLRRLLLPSLWLKLECGRGRVAECLLHTGMPQPLHRPNALSLSTSPQPERLTVCRVVGCCEPVETTMRQPTRLAMYSGQFRMARCRAGAHRRLVCSSAPFAGETCARWEAPGEWHPAAGGRRP